MTRINVVVCSIAEIKIKVQGEFLGIQVSFVNSGILYPYPLDFTLRDGGESFGRNRSRNILEQGIRGAASMTRCLRNDAVCLDDVDEAFNVNCARYIYMYVHERCEGRARSRSAYFSPDK